MAVEDSIQIFVNEAIPGTMSMVAMKKRKSRIENPAEIQYVQERICSLRNSLPSFNNRPLPTIPCND